MFNKGVFFSKDYVSIVSQKWFPGGWGVQTLGNFEIFKMAATHQEKRIAGLEFQLK